MTSPEAIAILVDEETPASQDCKEEEKIQYEIVEEESEEYETEDLWEEASIDEQINDDSSNYCYEEVESSVLKIEKVNRKRSRDELEYFEVYESAAASGEESILDEEQVECDLLNAY